MTTPGYALELCLSSVSIIINNYQFGGWGVGIARYFAPLNRYFQKHRYNKLISQLGSRENLQGPCSDFVPRPWMTTSLPWSLNPRIDGG